MARERAAGERAAGEEAAGEEAAGERAAADVAANGGGAQDQSNGVRDRFSHRIYVADFGSYEGNRRAEEPDNELLVGREKQRARLLNLLLNTAQRGAYLVTGHRGSGKTTFVNYCLNEYRFEIFFRYLKSNLGRAFLWDRFGLVAFGVLVFLLGIVLHQTLGYLLLDGEIEHVVQWGLVAVLTLIALHPMVAAYERFKLIAERLVELGELRRIQDAENRERKEESAEQAAGEKRFESEESGSEVSENEGLDNRVAQAREPVELPPELESALDEEQNSFRTLAERSRFKHALFRLWENKKWQSAWGRFEDEKERAWAGELWVAWRAFRAQLTEGLRKSYPWTKRQGKKVFQALAGSERPNARPLLALLLVASFLWFWVAFPRPGDALAEMVYIAGWTFFFAAIAHESFPRSQEIHVVGLVALAATDLLLLTYAFPHWSPMADLHAEWFWTSGLFAGSLGLLLVAFHKHAAVQQWYQNAAYPLGLVRQSMLDDFRRRGKDKEDPRLPIRRASIQCFWVIAVSAFFIAVGYADGVWGQDGLSRPFSGFDLSNVEPWSLYAWLALAFLPVWADLFVLALPTVKHIPRDQLKDKELSETARSVISAARWHLLVATGSFGGALFLLYCFPSIKMVFAFSAFKAVVALTSVWILYLALRGLRLLLNPRAWAVIREGAPEGAPEGRWMSLWAYSRYRTRADGRNVRQELLQAAISGQQAQPLLLIFGKAVILVLVGLQLAYPSLSLAERAIDGLIASQHGETQSDAMPYCGGERKIETMSQAAEAKVVDLFSGLCAFSGTTQDPASGLSAAGIAGFATFAREAESESTKGRNLKALLDWVISLLILTFAVAFLEYEWILRGGQHVRPDHPLKQQTSEVRVAVSADPERTERTSRSYQRRLFEQTLFWRVHQAWLPILVVPVNLGFDSLDHRRVVEAMLIGLRDRYSELFFRWSSPMRLVLRGGGLILLFWLTVTLGNRWFFIDEPAKEDLQMGVFCQRVVPHNGPLQEGKAGAAMEMVCLGGESLARLTQWELVRSPKDADNPYKAWSGAAYEGSVFATFYPEIQRTGALTFRVYHLLIFVILLGFSSWILNRWGFLPYRRTLDEIELLLSQISSRQHQELRYHPSLIPRLVGVFTGEDTVRHWEAEPFDPRTIEISVLRILRDIQDPTVHFPYLTRHRVNLPTPEIIFKFDELDKLGIGVLPQHDTAGPEIGETEDFDLERQRSRSLHSLFADLKNLVSSGAARFIFIGGRNLHDEWLADQTARRPLLTNIFEVEIYLPSLLLGEVPADSDARNLTDGIVTFVEAQYQHAVARNHRMLLHRHRPWLTPWLENPADPIFVQATHKLSGRELPSFSIRTVPPAPEGRWQKMNRWQREAGEPERKVVTGERRWGDRRLPDWQDALGSDFIEFLAYRSRGNVKRLKSTLERFIEPSLKVLGPDLPVDCQHVLVFRDIARFRIQLIAEVYRRIISAFDPRIRFYDDKLVVGLLYIADFLLKFHRRAFAWGSLQKVDELVHIHRAPELPNAIADLLHAWQQKYLHRIRNGMYDYRFNSDFAMELQYLSRRSDEELAALNFTLDESQALKSIYRSRFSKLKDPAAFEFVAVLGELHELDGEHDVARYYYNRAISYLDEHFHVQVARKKDEPAIFAVLSLKNKGLEAARRRIAWGMTRLRLKMQIGMSYEQSNDLEQAQAHYRNARTFAFALISALLNARRDGHGKIEFLRTPDYGKPDYISTLKHLNLLFQPAFAEAWVSEKHPGGVDTSTRLIERSVWELRWKLPLVREEFDPKNLLRLCKSWVPEHDVLHLNFALIMAEQHNKVGDLLFFKGGVSVDAAPGRPPRRSLGYLTRSRYHYAVALHEIRFFNRSRLLRWAENHGGTVETDTSPMGRGEWGDFVFRSTAGSLADFGETFLAGTSAFETLCRVEMGPRSSCRSASLQERLEKKSASFEKLAAIIQYWLGGSIDDRDAAKIAELNSCLMQESGGHSIEAGWRALSLRSAFGDLRYRWPKDELRHEAIAKSATSATSAQASSWLPPFETALGRWFGQATDQSKLLEDLDKDLLGREEVEVKEKLEEGRGEEESPGWRRSWRRRFRGGQKWRPSNLAELGQLADGQVQDLIKFDTMSDPLESIAAYFSIGWSAGSVLEKGGFYEDAARKYLRLLESVVNLLSWSGVIRLLRKDHGTSSDEAQPRSAWREIYPWIDPRCERPLVEELLDLGLLFLDKAEGLYRRGRTEWETQDQCEIGTLFPTQMHLLACALGLAELGLVSGEAVEGREDSRLGRLKGYLLRWNGTLGSPTPEKGRKQHRKWFRDRIISIIERNAYPLIGRLVGLKLLVDDAVLSGRAKLAPVRGPEQDSEKEREENRSLLETCQHLSELMRLEDLYDARWHFTPLQIGSTLAIWSLQDDDLLDRIRRLLADQDEIERECGRRHESLLPPIHQLREAARRRLLEGQEMYTMRRSYYRSIGRLFYLHDDFNDRRIHYNHAVQMSAAEISQALIDQLRGRIAEEDGASQGAC